VIHYHALLSRVPDDIGRFEAMRAWEQVGGFARVFPFERERGREIYIVQYAAKGGEIDFGGPLSPVSNRLPAL
jgi:hypothetical protein